MENEFWQYLSAGSTIGFNSPFIFTHIVNEQIWIRITSGYRCILLVDKINWLLKKSKYWVKPFFSTYRYMYVNESNNGNLIILRLEPDDTWPRKYWRVLSVLGRMLFCALTCMPVDWFSGSCWVETHVLINLPMNTSCRLRRRLDHIQHWRTCKN